MNSYQGKFDPQSSKSYKISRTKVEFFLDCPRCFYLDRKYAIKRPPSFPFNLNSAVDNLLKNEFDIYRAQQSKHPFQIENNIDAIPFQHKDLDKWRHNFTGISYLHPKTNFYFFGAVDDVWINSSKELIVVDYKATSKNEAIKELNQPWQDGYKRQMEFYQWLLRGSGFKVSDISYFVYCNGKRNEERFNTVLRFDINLIRHNGNTDWIEPTIEKLYECLMSNTPPAIKEGCEYCQFTERGSKV